MNLFLCRYYAQLLASIDSHKAVSTFRRLRETLNDIISNDLSNVTNALYARQLISNETKNKALNEAHTTTVRTIPLLDAVESKMRLKASIFAEFVHILDSEPYLHELADELVQSYCK